MSIITKIFGTYSDHQIKKVMKQVNRIESLGDTYRAMSDAEMRQKTDEFRALLAEGKTLDDILPDAFALTREAADRVLGKRPFKVQLICGIMLHKGAVTEMKTGEGKTLVAVMPSYLNALTGKGVHVVTVNDYLARVGAEEMGRVHEFLGLSTGLILAGQDPEEKKKAYGCDITYGTNNEFGFDYLRDNMAVYESQLVQRGHHFAIVDEVDSILIDEARTPLIISGSGNKSNQLYDMAERLASSMSKLVIKETDKKDTYEDVTQDYIVDEKAKTATLTEAGIAKTERFFNIENLSAPENADINHHINIAIKAHGVMKNEIDYIVKDNQVIIVDAFTGRLMPGRRYSDGLHQAIEAKEHVEVQNENQTVATITFQNYFRMYDKLSGMTGTALSEEEEFNAIYGLNVIEIPTNKPMIRIDHPDVVFTTKAGKDQAIIEQIRECHEKGQPVLVGTVSIEKSEELSRKLSRTGIPHTVLNAKFHEKEAEIVAQAGKLGAVTISTNMAGRGTDILLGGNAEYLAKGQMRKEGYSEELIALATGSSQSVSEEVFAARKVFRGLYEKYQEEIRPEAEKVCEVGGLFVIGTERHEARRIDNQLRGRSGRQGDPGESRFFLSMEDDLMRLFGGERIQMIVSRLGLPDDQPIDSKILSNSIESAQKRLEGNNFQRRKYVLDYDDVMNQQRQIIYKQRQDVLHGMNLRDTILGMIENSISEHCTIAMGDPDPSLWDMNEIYNNYAGMICKKNEFDLTAASPEQTRETIISTLIQRAHEFYEMKETKIFTPEQMREVERVVLLRNVDRNWMEHLEDMDHLMESVGLQAYANRKPIDEYRIVGADLFDAMVNEIRDSTARMMLSVMPREKAMQREQVVNRISLGSSGGDKSEAKKPVVNKTKKIGRNDPCPCGSGKKYKNCCGR